MAKPRRRLFGPLFYSTVVIAFLSTGYTAVVVGWATVEESLRKRSVLREEQALIASLRTNDSKVREGALAALMEKGSKAVVPYLLEAANDPRGDLRVLAYRYLVETDAGGEVVVPILAAAAGDRDENVRSEAVLAFRRLLLANSMRLIPVSAPVVQAGRIIVIPIREMTPALRGLSIKALRPLLKDRANTTRIAAADALGQLGPDRDSGADLVSATADADRDVQLAAARALLKVNGANDRTAGRTLVALIGSQDPIGERMMILDLLKSASAGAQDQAIAVLGSLLTDADPTIHQDVIDCLVAAGPRARLALPALERLLNDKDPEQRCTAAIAVARIAGKTSPRALPTLLRMIEDIAVMPERRQSILGIIRESNAADLVKVTPILIRQLGSKDPQVRITALGMLGEIIENTRAEMPAPISGK
jgi:HEAT repeat protein